MRNAEAMAIATRAALAWGTPASPPRLVQNRENAVFDLSYVDGRRVALRLHRAGYQTPQGITAELRWLESLADAGFACPWPQRTTDGALVHTHDGTTVSAVQWIDGPAIGAGGTPFDPALGDQTQIYHDLGALLADLHLTSDAVAPLDIDRPGWNEHAFCCENAPLWGRFWENATLSADESALLCRARDAAREKLAMIPGDQTGLIHADVLQENVLMADGLLFLIDFDDGGAGYRLYDLATALIQHCDTPHLPDLRAALLAGYAQADGPLPASALGDLDMFIMLRALASAGWVMARTTPDDPRQRAYADRAVRLARDWMA